MNWNDFVYKAVYDGCIKENLCSDTARRTANKALDNYKQNNFVKPSKLIDQAIKDAKKQFKKEIEQQKKKGKKNEK